MVQDGIKETNGVKEKVMWRPKVKHIKAVIKFEYYYSEVFDMNIIIYLN